VGTVSGEIFDWDPQKAAKLLRERGVTFEELAALIEAGRYVARIEHPRQDRYPGQIIFAVVIDSYLWAVPADPKNGGWTLRTAFPSRALKRLFGDRVPN